MNKALRTKCDVQAKRGCNVMLSVRGGCTRDLLKKLAFEFGTASNAPMPMDRTPRPTYPGLQRYSAESRLPSSYAMVSQLYVQQDAHGTYHDDEHYLRVDPAHIQRHQQESRL